MKKIAGALFCFILCISIKAVGQELLSEKELGTISPVISKITEQEAKEPAIILFDKVFIEHTLDNKQNLHRYFTRKKRVHLNENVAIEQFNRIFLPIESSEQLVSLKAVAISKNGQLKEVGKENIKEIEEDGVPYKILAIEGLEQGGELEYYFCIKQDTRFYGSEKIQGSTFIRDYQLTIVSPENLVWEGRLYNFNKQFTDSLAGDKRLLKLQLKNIEESYEEKYSAGEANDIRAEYKIAYNKARGSERLFTWAYAGQRIFDIIHDGQKNAEADIAKLANQLNLSSMKEEEAISTIENYIKANIVIRENVDRVGIKNVLSRKYGLKEEVIQLYAFLFEHLQIPYQMVLCSDRFEKKFDKDFDTWNFLNDYLIYFNNSRKYLSPQNVLLRYGMYPNNYSGSDALFIKGVTLGGNKTGIALTKKIEELPADKNDDDTFFEISLTENLSQVKGVYKRELSGYAASDIRPIYFLSNDEDRKMLMSEYLKAYTFKDADIKNVKIENADINTPEVNKPFKISADVTVKSIIEKAGSKLILKIGELIGPQTEMYNEKTRQTPMELTYPHAYHRTLTIVIPQGYSVKGLDGLKLNHVYQNGSESMGFTSDFTLENNILKVNINEYYNNIMYPISSYNDFIKIINAAADFNKVTIVLEKTI